MKQYRTIHEDDLHCALAQWLNLMEKMGKLKGIWWHTDNTHSSVQRAVKLKRMGMRAGVFDLQFIHDDNFTAWIELKTKRGRLNPDQKIFIAKLEQRKIPYIVIKTDDTMEVINRTEEFLTKHGFLSGTRSA